VRTILAIFNVATLNVTVNNCLKVYVYAAYFLVDLFVLKVWDTDIVHETTGNSLFHYITASIAVM
jgi:hypothetical protein